MSRQKTGYLFMARILPWIELEFLAVNYNESEEYLYNIHRLSTFKSNKNLSAIQYFRQPTSAFYSPLQN